MDAKEKYHPIDQSVFSPRRTLVPEVLRYVMAGVLTGLVMLPVAKIVSILASTGADNLSNDYALFLPIIDKIASGSYDWSSFLRDSFNVSHFQPLPILIHLGNALLTGWNIYYELFFIVVLSIVRALLTYQALTHAEQHTLRYLMLPVVSLLVFSASQISSFEFGASAVREGLTAFGITLGIWGLVKFKKATPALLITFLGGLIASWTAAPGIMIWPVFLLGMLTLGYSKIRDYAAWLVAAVVINFPYLYFLLLDRKQGVNASLHSLLDLRLVVNIIGRPFANGIGSTTEFLPIGEAAGWIGLLLGTLGVGMVIVQRRHLLNAVTPAFMFMAYGILTAWQTSVYRVLIAPWYTTMVMSYWIGLAGLAYLLAAKGSLDERESTVKSWKRHILTAFPLVVFVVMAGLYLATNLTYRDKSFYLVSRSPASAACLRHYEWAPTYCERSVFQWTVNRVFLADFAQPLQRQGWSVFNQHQRWTMQGEVILGNVYSPQAPYTLGVTWFDGIPGEPASFRDYRHLNARVTPDRSAAWRVNLPGDMMAAEFSSAVAVGKGEASAQAPVNFEVSLSVEGGPEVLVIQQKLDSAKRAWTEFNIDLSDYRGKQLVILLAVDGVDEQTAALYRFPTIDLVMPAEVTVMAPEVKPNNVIQAEGSPQPTSQDYQFDIKTAQVKGLSAVKGAANTWQVQANPHILIQLDQPLSLEEYGWLAFNLAASPDIHSRGAELRLYFEGQDEPVSLVIPLMKDGASYTYTYPLWMVDIPGKLTALRLDPVELPAARGESIITVEEIRLIRRRDR